MFVYRDGAFLQTNQFEHEQLIFNSDEMHQCDINNDGKPELKSHGLEQHLKDMITAALEAAIPGP